MVPYFDRRYTDISKKFGISITTAQSNVGLTTGLTSPDMHWLIKLDFMVLMWMGRLELIAVLFLFTGWFRQN